MDSNLYSNMFLDLWKVFRCVACKRPTVFPAIGVYQYTGTGPKVTPRRIGEMHCNSYCMSVIVSQQAWVYCETHTYVFHAYALICTYKNRKLKRKRKQKRGNLREGREAPPRRCLHPFCFRFFSFFGFMYAMLGTIPMLGTITGHRGTGTSWQNWSRVTMSLKHPSWNFNELRGYLPTFFV